MPTDIYFAGDNVWLRVEEDPGQVAEALGAAEGLPFRLTGRGGEREVYVNPAMVAFWFSPEMASEEGSPPEEPGRREAVTDIWGNPLRRRRRR